MREAPKNLNTLPRKRRYRIHGQHALQDAHLLRDLPTFEQIPFVDDENRLEPASVGRELKAIDQAGAERRLHKRGDDREAVHIGRDHLLSLLAFSRETGASRQALMHDPRLCIEGDVVADREHQLLLGMAAGQAQRHHLIAVYGLAAATVHADHDSRLPHSGVM